MKTTCSGHHVTSVSPCLWRVGSVPANRTSFAWLYRPCIVDIIIIVLFWSLCVCFASEKPPLCSSFNGPKNEAPHLRWTWLLRCFLALTLPLVHLNKSPVKCIRPGQLGWTRRLFPLKESMRNWRSDDVTMFSHRVAEWSRIQPRCQFHWNLPSLNVRDLRDSSFDLTA